MNKLLMIEDDADLAEGTQYALKKENYDVEWARDLESALEFFNKDKFDLVLLDLKLPDGSGYNFCKKVRETSDMPIIFLTACDEEVNIVMGLDIGADDYITKPFRLKELLSRIRAVLRRKSQISKNEPETLISGDLKVLASEGRVLKNDQDLNLTSVEYKLLLLFIKNPKMVLSRNVILEGIWDMNGLFVDDNSLSVNIRRLRKKIEDDSENPSYIHTLRGLGYKWDKVVRRLSDE